MPHGPHRRGAAPYQLPVLKPRGGHAPAGGTGAARGRALGHVPGWRELAAGCTTGAAGLGAGVLGREGVFGERKLQSLCTGGQTGAASEARPPARQLLHSYNHSIRAVIFITVITPLSSF